MGSLVTFALYTLGLLLSQPHASAPACPTPDELDQALRDVGEDPGQWARFRIDVDHEATPAVLTVAPRDADEAVVTRSLRVQGDCADLAATIAVILASLKTELPGFPSAVDLPAREPPMPLPDEPVVVERPAQVLKPDPRRPARLPLSLQGGWTVAAGQSSPTFQFAASAAPVPGRFLHFDFAVRYAARTEVSLGPGEASWDRWSIALAPVGTFDLGVADLRASLGPQLSRLGIHGRGYPEDRGATTVTWGVTAGAQLALGQGGWQPLLGLQTSYWPGTQRLSLSGAPQHHEVARWDVFASLGVFLPVK